MLIKKGLEKDWEKFVAINSEDFYSRGVVDYMIKWANLMEQTIIKNGSLTKRQADKLSTDADTMGITGFMYDMARKFLYKYWQYGDNLKKMLGTKMTSVIEIGGLL